MFNIYFKEMKKFISLIALVGVFAACEPENLQTAFTVNNATATITVTPASADPNFNAAAVTYDYEWSTGDTAKGVGNTTMEISGTPAIEAGYVKVTAYYEGAKSETEMVSFPKLYAGMNVALSVTVFLPYNAGDYTLSVEKGEPKVDVEVYGLQAAAHGHGYGTPVEFTVKCTFDEKEYSFKKNLKMMENASEFLLEDTYTWKVYSGTENLEDYKYVYKTDDFKQLAQLTYEGFVKNFKGINYISQSMDFVVSAWALYNVVNPEFTVITPCSVIATPNGNDPKINVPIATFSIKEKISSAKKEEVAHPDHASHYDKGHGHYTPDGHYAHGDNNNAGGGIITAE